MLPPNDIEKPGIVWKLKRCIYGLNDAPRAWFVRVKNELSTLGAIQSSFDMALFVWHENKELCGILVAHVDDFAFIGTDGWQKSVIATLKSKFKISAESAGTFNI